MLLQEKDAQSIVDEMKASIHRDINIMDERGVIIASTNPARRGTLHLGAARIIRDGLSSLTIGRDNPEEGVQRGINLPISIGGELAGVIGITGDPSEVSVFGDIIKRMTEIMVKNVRQQEENDLQDQAKRLFLENWIFSQYPDWPDLEVRGRLLGFRINEPYRIALLDMDRGERPEHGQSVSAEPAAENEAGALSSASRTAAGGIRPGTAAPDGAADAVQADSEELQNGIILRKIQDYIRREPGQYCLAMRSRIMILLCRSSPAGTSALLGRICRDIESEFRVGISAGVSSVSRAPAEIRRCYMEAQTAANVAAQAADRRIVFYNQVSTEFIALSIPPEIRKSLEQLVFAGCTREERQAFSKLIRLYYEEDGDLNRCAAHAFVHRNTIRYHISQIRKKTGYDLRIPRDAMLLCLAAQTRT